MDPITTTINLNGTWASGGVSGPIISVTGNTLSIDMSSYKRPTATGTIVDASTISATFPDDKIYSAKLQLPNEIVWSNNSVWTKVSASTLPPLPYLHSVSITFNTHSEDDKDGDTVLHVFLKNRSIDTSFSENSGDYISNHLSYLDHEGSDPYEVNPYLASFENLAPGTPFHNGSSNTYFLTLREKPIPCAEIVLPVVNIHILPNGDDTWVFDFVVKFYFADPNNASDPNHKYDFSFPSNTNGITGIVLGQDNRNYVGIGTENPNGYIPPTVKPVINSVLTKVVLDFNTRGGSKDSGTQVNVHIVNRLSASVSHDIAIGLNIFPNQAFQPTTPQQANSIELNVANHLLVSNALHLQDIVLPVVNIVIVPDSSQGRWMFDFQVRYYFSYGPATFALEYASTTTGIDLDGNEKKYAAVYQGNSFPTVAPVEAQFTKISAIDHTSTPKIIPLSFLKRKLDEVINSRQSSDPQSPSAALNRLRLHNSGVFGSAAPANYYDLLSIDANPPAPGTVVTTAYAEGVTWGHSPSDQGPDDVGGKTFAVLDDINSSSLTLTFDTSRPTPLTLAVNFETDGPPEVYLTNVLTGPIDTIDFTQFSIQISLTLTRDPQRSRIDVMSWVADIESPNNLKYANGKVTGSFLGEPVSIDASSLGDGQTTLLEKVLTVSLTAPGKLTPGGIIRQSLRDKIFSALKDPDPITRKSTLDNLNAQVNSWLLGGITDSAYTVIPGDNTSKVSQVKLDAAGVNLEIYYTGPQYVFQPPVPQGWPTAHEFDPGALANIDHIVVLTMENRSFDQMLGYLSLPVGAGGMGRAEVDGLKGGEFNLLHDGTRCPSVPFKVGETVFAPDPPHSFEPVGKAINGGRMDGFAESYAQAHGPVVGPNIMKYHPATNVPTYDELARDFAIGHRWFAAHPGPTFSNRFHELTGRLNIDPYGFWELSNSSPLRPVFTDTIFDHLSAAGVSWKYFEHHYCFLRFFERHTFDDKNIVTFDDPEFGFANLARTGNLPSVTFIDPHFIELPPGGNCDGPPADIQEGQLLVRQVVEAVVSSPAWSKTLLLVTYDEHGGFFDHVPPSPAAQIAPGLPQTHGVRVPAFVISPWVAAGSVFGNDAQGVGKPALHFDHTSILKTIAKRFLSANPPYMGARFAAANDLSSLITNTPRSTQFRPFIKYHIQYAPSKMRLEVPGSSFAPNTALWVNSLSAADAQAYSFEDAGNGSYYIRTHTGGLYLTAQPNGTTAIVTQQPKLPTGGSTDSQRWTFSRGLNLLATSTPALTIHNAAFAGLVLQPAGNSLQPEIAAVLDVPLKALPTPNPWIVTSDLLPDTSGELAPPNS